MSEPEEGTGWRVRTGGGLLAAQPLSDALREAHRKEDEREAAQLERDREMRAQLAAERRAELLMQGREPHTLADVFALQSFGEARNDAAERRLEEAAAERLGRPRPYTALLREAKAEREARAAEAEQTPVSQAEFGRLVSKLKTTIGNTFGKRLLS